MTNVQRTLDSLTPYPAYDSTRLSLVPLVPSGWEVRALQSLCSVKARLGWKALKADEYVPDGFVFLATPNIKGASIDFENVNYISEFRYLESPEIALEEDDVLLAKDGSTLGIVNVVTHLPRPSTVNSSIAVLRTIKSSMRGDFLRYLLSSHLMQAEIEKVKGGMGVPHLFQSDIKKFALLVPPIEDQVAIAAFLDHETARIDELVREQEHLLDDLAEKRRATCINAVTQGLHAKAIREPVTAWLPALPAHWQSDSLKRLVHIQGGMTPPDEPHLWNGGVPWVTPKDMKRPVIIETEDTVSDLAVSEGRLKLFPAGCLLMVVRSGILRHVVPVAVNGAPVTVNQDMKVFQPVAAIRAKFLYYFFEGLGPSLLPVIQKVGATVESINMAALRNLQVPVPPQAEQEEITTYLDERLAQIDRLVLDVRENIEDMKLLRSTLITAATTGRIDVRDWRPA